MSSDSLCSSVDGAPSDSVNIPLSDIVFEKRIGRGAFGEVWKCCYFGTDVAVKKMLRPDDHWVRTLIKREIQALRACRHPNVVQFIGLCKDKTDIYIVTEYIDGGSVWKLLKNKSKQLSWLARVNLALDVSKALAYLHSRNIIHRDLKCKNLLVDRNLHVKVCDFGLCRDTGQAEQKFMTKAGTDEWMAPEVILGNPYNAKADSYSFGMVLYELITRSKPPQRDVMNGFQVDLEQFTSAFPPDCPPELAQLAIDCVNSDSNLRPAFLEILNRLKDIKEKLRLEQKANRQLKQMTIDTVVHPEYPPSELLLPPPPLVVPESEAEPQAVLPEPALPEPVLPEPALPEPALPEPALPEPLLQNLPPPSVSPLLQTPPPPLEVPTSPSDSLQASRSRLSQSHPTFPPPLLLNQPAIPPSSPDEERRSRTTSKIRLRPKSVEYKKTQVIGPLDHSGATISTDVAEEPDVVVPAPPLSEGKKKKKKHASTLLTSIASPPKALDLEQHEIHQSKKMRSVAKKLQLPAVPTELPVPPPLVLPPPELPVVSPVDTAATVRSPSPPLPLTTPAPELVEKKKRKSEDKRKSDKKKQSELVRSKTQIIATPLGDGQ